MPQDVVRVCTGKKVFSSFSLAAGAAKRANRAHDDGHLAAYHCKHCNTFHVGESRRLLRREERRPASNRSE